ncbi:MAG: NAD-dependent epimerase/dehydratase family protein [Bacteroidia bacterium]|jgi:nucleoside-diphosphate-sugar epimerase
MQTILGSGGAIGTELAKSLKQYTSDIKLVSRNPKKVNDTDTLHQADLSDPAQVSKAIEGSEICYLTLGYDYNTKLWQEKWPSLIKNVVQGCIDHKSKLIFFDNVYAIGGDNVKHITESSPISPNSKKGEVRAFVDKHILENVEKGKIEAIIARAPDFFGTIKDRSLLMNLIYDNLVKGKAAQWFCNADVVHTTGFAPDLAKGTAILGNSPGTFNQVWNLPIDSARITGREWVKLFAAEMKTSDKVQVLPGWGMRALGVFVPILKEMYEMRYQYDREYYFDSSKFNKAFNFTPTTNSAAVKLTVAALEKK